MSAPERDIGRIGKVLEAAALITGVAALLIITVTMIGQVFSRYVLGQPLQWSEVISVYALVWLVFLGAAASSFSDEHVSIPSLTDRLSPRGRGLAMVFSRLCVIAFSAITCWVSWGWLVNGFHVQAASLGFSTRWVKLALPIGIGLMGAAAVLYVIRDIAAIAIGRLDRFSNHDQD
jgi:TRAP-type C4-dicarboxylate transport system permease small subunit